MLLLAHGSNVRMFNGAQRRKMYFERQREAYQSKMAIGCANGCRIIAARGNAVEVFAETRVSPPRGRQAGIAERRCGRIKL